MRVIPQPRRSQIVLGRPSVGLLDANSWIGLDTHGVEELLAWLVEAGVGPAVVALPVTWAAADLAGSAARWFRRIRHSDGLSRIIRAAAGPEFGLSEAEYRTLRHLLESESTWAQVGRGTIEDLTGIIASGLQDRNDALKAARGIARGLLEFAVSDLDPPLFQRVLFARLDRLERHLGSALDEVMLSVHADLAAYFAQQEEADAARSLQVMSQLARILEGLPTRLADQGGIALYLAALIRWLNTDPWPRDSRFSGPSLTPAGIERKLLIADADDDDDGEDLVDADTLADNCERLVILGGPGAGKTWLAKRTARRCAEKALAGLRAEASLNDVELPLYTTCSQLVVADGEDIRQAVVSAAMSQLPDLGSSRLNAALRDFFAERSAPTVLVIDSLDEATGPDDRIRQADTLLPPWRIILTSRQASWQNQLDIEPKNPYRRVGELQRLSYPYDVEPFIRNWYKEQPEWGERLCVQLAERPLLQYAATVPLMLAFYCIIGREYLPRHRTDLCTRVINRMLTGRWRGSGDREPENPAACLAQLREWAWSAAVKDECSGVGIWSEEIETEPVLLSETDRNALDHVAEPVQARNIDTGVIARRFVHRSLREQLVAAHVAQQMTTTEAADELLKHVWYDTDWEYAAPAALAMRPDRDQVLSEMIMRMTGSPEIPTDLAQFDGCWELRRFLNKVAADSGEDDWSPAAAEFIGQARVDLVLAGNFDYLRQTAAEWPESNYLIYNELLDHLEDTDYRGPTMRLAEALAELPVSPKRRESECISVSRLLMRTSNDLLAINLAVALARLGPSSEIRAQARDALLRLLGRETGAARDLEWSNGDWAKPLALLAATTEELARTRRSLRGMLAVATSGWQAIRLTDALSALDPTEADCSAALENLLRPLILQDLDTEGRDTYDSQLWFGLEWAATVMRLEPTAMDRSRARHLMLRRLIALDYGRFGASQIVEALEVLSPTAAELADARRVLLSIVVTVTESQLLLQLIEVVDGLDSLVELVDGLDSDEQSRARVCQTMLEILAEETDSHVARRLSEGICNFGANSDFRAQAQRALLNMLISRSHEALYPGYPTSASGMEIEDLADALAFTAVTISEQAETCDALLGILAHQPEGWYAVRLAQALTSFEPSARQRATGRRALVAMLARTMDSHLAAELAKEIERLILTTEDGALTRIAALAAVREVQEGSRVRELGQILVMTSTTDQDRTEVRETLLNRVASSLDVRFTCDLVNILVALEPSEQERSVVRAKLLEALSHCIEPIPAMELVQAVFRIQKLTEKEMAQIRASLLRLLAGRTLEAVPRSRALASVIAVPYETSRSPLSDEFLLGMDRLTDNWTLTGLTSLLVELSPSRRDKEQAFEFLLRRLYEATSAKLALPIAQALVALRLTAEQLPDVRKKLLAILEHADRVLAFRIVQVAMVFAEDVSDLVHMVMLVARADDAIHLSGQQTLPFDDAYIAALEAADATTVLIQLLLQGSRPLPHQADVLGTLFLANTGLTRVCATLLRVLGARDQDWLPQRVVRMLARLSQSAEDRNRACGVLLSLLARDALHSRAGKLADAVVSLPETGEERTQVRQTLLGLLTQQTDGELAARLADALIRLDPTEQDVKEARVALLKWLALGPRYRRSTWSVQRAALRLNLTAPDLEFSRSWAEPTSSDFLSAVRRRSPLNTWLASLTFLSALPRTDDLLWSTW
jgi:hypothetical protein